MYKTGIQIAFLLFIVCAGPLHATTEKKQVLLYPLLVNKFYAATHQQMFWYTISGHDKGMKTLLLQKLDSAAFVGTDRKQYRYELLPKEGAEQGKDSAALMQMDMLLTDATIAYCKDLYQGAGINKWIRYDEWSSKYAEKDNELIISHLAAVHSAGELKEFIHSLEPDNKEYLAYKAELFIQYRHNHAAKLRQVATSMNFYRWIHHFRFERSIVVNIASATLRYYDHDTEALFSKMIVGKPARKTPRFDATCTDVVLYPYWNVPADIALKELLPKYKRSPGLVNRERMQLLDAHGNIVNPHSINWAAYSSHYFPYRLRQSTGCDNSLGIIKLNLTSPFGVYLHDTNEKGLFASNNRYRSHGCMRVEKAIQLGNYLLNNKLDTVFLLACIKGEKPITLKLEKPVPVLVVYLTAELTDSNAVNYYPDVYHLISNLK